MADIPIQGTLAPNGGFAIVDGPIKVSPSPSARVVIYVRPGGNDTTGDGTSPATAFRTVQHAVNTIPLIQRGVSYVVDITGINDTNQNVVLPPFTNSDPPPFNATGPLDPIFWIEGYVTIAAQPVILDSLNQGTTSGVPDPITTMVTVTDTSKAWTPDQYKGKMICGSGNFEFGIITSNTPTDLKITTFFGNTAGPNPAPFTFPLHICDYGATLTPATNLPAIDISGVKATVVVHGVQMLADSGGFVSFSGANFSNVTLSMCQIGPLRFSNGGGVDIEGCYLTGPGGGVQTNSVWNASEIALDESYIVHISPAVTVGEITMLYTVLEDVRAFDGGNIGGSSEIALCQFITQGLTVAGPLASIAVFNVRVDNAVPIAHINPNGSGIHAFGGGVIQFAEGAIGGTGNAGYGVELGANGSIWMEVAEPVNISITGALGDLKVGNRPPRTWTDFTTNPPLNNEVDFSHLSRIGLNVGGGNADAAALPFIPTTPNDWYQQGGSPPSDVGGALDELGARITDTTYAALSGLGLGVGLLVKPWSGTPGVIGAQALTLSDDGSVVFGVCTQAGLGARYESTTGRHVPMLSDGTAIAKSALVYASGISAARVSAVARGPAVGIALLDAAPGSEVLFPAMLLLPSAPQTTIVMKPSDTWATIAAQIHGPCRIVLDNDGQPFPTFTLTGSNDLSKVIFDGTMSTSICILTNDPTFVLTTPYLQLVSVLFFATQTLYTGAADGLLIIDGGVIDRVNGTAGPLFTTTGRFTVSLVNSGFTQNDDKTDYIVTCNGISDLIVTGGGNADHKTMNGASAAQTLNFTTDDTAVYQTDSIGPNFNISPIVLSKAAQVGYTPAVSGNWPEGAPVQAADALDKLAARTVPTAWTDATCINFWIPYTGAAGQATPGFAKNGDGLVSLRGWLQGGVSGTTAFVLPVEYRPAHTMQFPTTTDSAHLGIIQIDSGGNVKVYDHAGESSASTLTTLDSIHFYAGS